MKQTLLIGFMTCSTFLSIPAQTPTPIKQPAEQVASTNDPAQTNSFDPLIFPEPEFVGQVLAIRPNRTPEQLPQESLIPRQRSSIGNKLFGFGKEYIEEVTLDGARAAIRFKADEEFAFIIRVTDNSINPMQQISIFRFKSKRKIRTAQTASIGEMQGTRYNSLDRQPFTARRFGKKSYLIILKDAQAAEYAISLDAMGSLNVSTFGIDK